MIPARLHDATRNSAAGIRRLALAMYAVGLVLNVGVSQAAPGARQRHRAVSPARDGGFEASIGHRQPTAEDLSQGVLRDEGTATQNQRSFDKQLNICRGC